MSNINWDDLAEKSTNQTDITFNSQMASLTNLKLTEIDNFIKQSNISNTNAFKVIIEIIDAIKSNDQKAQAIAIINNGVGFLVRLVSKIV